MTHEEFEKAAYYWDNKEQTAMPEEALKQAVLKYIGENNTCALATGTGDYVRCTPIEYSFHDGKFWMFSEGGRKFIGLEKNSHVCLAIYDKYDGFGNLRSLQVTGDGRAFLGGVQRPCCFQEDPAGHSEKTALTDDSVLRDAYPHRCSVLRFQERRLQRPAGPASACVNRIS